MSTTTRTSRQAPTEAHAERTTAEREAAGATRRTSELQQTIGNQAVLRRVGAAGAPPDDAGIHRLADHGAAGPGGPLPFLDRIRASFGRHSVDHVRAFTGERAEAAATALGASAYTRGASVVFGRAPDLRTAAHEATHVVQQRGGVRLKSALGALGDVHERHANAVADRVVEGESAEPLLDRYADGPGGAPVVQRWGEPDHYMMGQLAGRKAVAALDAVTTTRERTYKLRDDETDLTEGKDFEQSSTDPTKVDRVDVPSSGKFFLRGPDGDPMSLGAANRFAGDFTKKAIESAKSHPSPSLDEMPKEIRKQYPKDLRAKEHVRATHGEFLASRFRVHKEYLDTGGFTEKTLMATNANHFFPLSTIEYRRQHTRALQKVWIAARLSAKGEALATTDETKAALLGDRANEAFRQAVMYEGFAGHFLADCFAAGHLSPHALGRIGDKSPATAGARVNTWHDLFNALPNGIPTSLGTFHGDYSMDGRDLEYVSSVISNSLLEVMMPWYTGQPYDGNVVTPVPDVAAIRRDPVAGPLWRAMCGDYKRFYDTLSTGTGRRKTKMGISKYVLYQTSAGSGVSKDELIPAVRDHVFGGSHGLDRVDDTDGELTAIRGKVHSIVAALAQVLGWRAGYQKATGLTQKYGTLHSQPGYKYNISLRSAQLAKISPTANPRKALIAELEHWIDVWRKECEKDEMVHKGELGLIEAASELLPLKEDTKEKTRRGWMTEIKWVLKKFATADERYAITAPLDEPVEQVEQGPDVAHSAESSSGTAIVAQPELAACYADERGPLDRFLWAVHSVLSEPRPNDNAEHRQIYDLLREEAQALRDDLGARYIASLDPGPANFTLRAAEMELAAFIRKLPRLRDAGLGLVSTRQETYRRDTIREIRLDLSACFEITPDRLLLTTGRSV